MSGETVVDLVARAIGRKPSVFVKSKSEVNAAHVRRLSAEFERWEIPSLPQIPQSQVRPLISHHSFDEFAMFGESNPTRTLDRMLTLLLAYDEVVASNPIQDVLNLSADGRDGDALSLFRRVVPQLAVVEPLVKEGVLLFTTARPGLASERREQILEAFGVEPQFIVFKRLIEIGSIAPELSLQMQDEFVRTVRALYGRFGQRLRPNLDIDGAVRAVRYLASTLIHLSWQLAVSIEEPACDISVSTPLEAALLAELLEEAAVAGLGNAATQAEKTRHLQMMKIGELPFLRSSDLRIADALAIRRNDTFSRFRISLREALDLRTRDAESGVRGAAAAQHFAEAMERASASLADRATKRGLPDVLRDQVVPAAVGVVTSYALSPLDPAIAAGGGLVGPAAGVLWQFFTARNDAKATRVSTRYCSILGGNRTNVGIG